MVMNALSWKARLRGWMKKNNWKAVFNFIITLAALTGLAIAIGMLYSLWHGVVVFTAYVLFDLMMSDYLMRPR
jgi:hypothetical protein